MRSVLQKTKYMFFIFFFLSGVTFAEKEKLSELVDYLQKNRQTLFSPKVYKELEELAQTQNCAGLLQEDTPTYPTQEQLTFLHGLVFLESKIAREALSIDTRLSHYSPEKREQMLFSFRKLIANLAFSESSQVVFSKAVRSFLVYLYDVHVLRPKKKALVAIAAMTSNRGIGLNGRLAWAGPMKNDYSRMLHLSRGRHVIMGRRTFEEISKNPIAGSKNIIITRAKDYKVPDGVEIASNLEEAISKTNGDLAPVLLGGGEVYAEAIKKGLVGKIELTRIHTELEADVFFPEIDLKNWIVTKKKDYQKDAENVYDYTFETLEKRKVVLVADDDDFIREVMTLMFSEIGMKVLTAQDGLEALELYIADVGQIDLIATDNSMPRLNGLGLIKKVREINKTVPIFLISADYGLDIDEQGVDYIQKPYRPEDIYNLLEMRLGE
ncbi:MAG: dihydrofolate reductase [Bacteriovoracia bacterium]